MGKFQQPNFPYRADPLNVHDEGLRFTKEFGIQVTQDVGDAFTTTPGATDVPAIINPRLGALQLDALSNVSIPADQGPRGRTYLLPEWDAVDQKGNPLFPDSPGLDPGEKSAVIYAHTCVKMANPFADIMATNRAQFMLAPDSLVGNVVGTPFATLDASDGATTFAGEIEAVEWDNGATPNMPSGLRTGITGVYWCILLVTDNVTKTEMTVWASNDGLCWYAITSPGSFSPNFTVRRLGLGVTGVMCALLDWVRVYAYPIDTVTSSFFEPAPPETGGRLYFSS